LSKVEKYQIDLELLSPSEITQLIQHHFGFKNISNDIITFILKQT